jgi:hypothetical protein
MKQKATLLLTALALPMAHTANAQLPTVNGGQIIHRAQPSGIQLPALGMTPQITNPQANGSLQKKPGTIRIGVVEPKAQIGQGSSEANIAEPLRGTIVQYLSGPTFEVIPITAMLPIQIDAEVKQKQCDYVLYSNISQKTTGSGMKMLTKALPLVSMVPMVGAVGGMAGAIAAGAAATGAVGMSGAVRAKSEVTFDYKLLSPGSDTPVLANSVKARAKADNEDILTPLIEQAASAVLGEIAKRTSAAGSL